MMRPICAQGYTAVPPNHEAHAKELSRLARIELTPEEEKTLGENIQNILKYMDQIEEVDTEGIPTCTTVLATLRNVFAEDEVDEEELLDRDTFLENVSDQIGGMVKIPPVISF